MARIQLSVRAASRVSRKLKRCGSLVLQDREAGRQLTRLSILTAISQALSVNLELEPLLETVHREVGRLFDTTNFYIALYRAGDPTWTWTYHIEHGVREAPTRHSAKAGLTGYILRSGEPLFLPVFRESRLELEQRGIFVLGEVPQSWMGVPLTVSEQVVGVMAVQSYEAEGVYHEHDLELFMAIASQIAVAIRNVRLYEDSVRKAREMEALVHIGQDVSSSLDLETVLARVVNDALLLLKCDSLAIFMKEPEGDFKTVTATGRLADLLRATRIRLGSGVLGSIAANARAEIANEASQDPRWIRIPGAAPDEEGDKLMAAPLTLGSDVIGLIAAWRNADNPPFEEADLTFLEGIGRQASIAIWNARLFGESRLAQAEAESANKAKSAFLASMSHELRTPLNAIILYSELLHDETTERGLGEFTADLDRIQHAGRHLLDLIDGILDLSKIEAGRMTVCLEDCNLPDLLSEIVCTIRPLVEQNHNRLKFDMDPSLQDIHSDPKKLCQIVFNLLNNASKFTRNGTIGLAVACDPQHSARVRFTITDTGIGMDPAQMARIFQEFAQAEETTSRNYGGTGLGLALCRKFTELLGGDIRVESAPGRGTAFIVSLPGLPFTPRP